MRKRTTAFLAVLFASIFSIAAVSEAQNMDKNRTLNTKQQSIISISAFTAKGDMKKLKAALHEGLDAGLTVNEIKEILVQLYAYTGFPRSLNGIGAFMDVMEERRKKGIKDDIGKEANPLPANKSSIELGTEVQTRLAGRPVTGAIFTFVPAIDQFLKGHLFGDIFGRDNLDFQSREIATISALASMNGVNSQLQAHFNIGLNTGLTEQQMRSLILVLNAKVSKKEADSANDILSKVLNSKADSEPTAPLVTTSKNSQTLSIIRSGSLSSIKGPVEYFTGSAHIEPLFQAHDPSRTSGSRITLEPGAREAWHTHPFGQILIVTTGSGWVQQWGGPIEEIRQGDIIWIPPGKKHWHGASAMNSITYIAIQEQLDGKVVEWMEKVSDDQYCR